MLRLIQAEFLKLRRKKFIVLMLLSALFMPLLAVFYFRSADKTVIEPLQFYKWTTFSYTASGICRILHLLKNLSAEAADLFYKCNTVLLSRVTQRLE